MDKDSFRILKEINSLYSDKKKLQELIANEKNRLFKVEQMRSERKAQLELDQKEFKQVNGELAVLENELAGTQTKLANTKANINNVFTEQEINSLQSQLTHLEDLQAELEEKLFSKLEGQEEVQSAISEAQNFLTGSLETLQEMQTEVDLATTPLLAKINSIEQRLALLFVELPESFKDKFLALVEKDLPYGPVAQIQNNHCSICKMTLSKIEIDEVEKQLKLKGCPSCARIFIPENTLY